MLTFNPLTLIRWLFAGKTLTEIVADFERKKDELESFFDRTEKRLAKKVQRIETLVAQNVLHEADMLKAKIVADNLKMLMTQALPTPPSPPAEDQAQ